MVGESFVEEAAKVLDAGGPVVLCGTVKALGSGWAHRIVSAARVNSTIRVFAVQIDKDAYIQQLYFDGMAFPYWRDPKKAVQDLIISIKKYYPTATSQAIHSVIRNQVFISYSHKDTKWLERLQIHLKPLEQLGTITRWDDTIIKPGAKWREEIKRGLESAKVAVLLVTADFLASDFITTNELPPLLAAAEEQGATVLPVVVSPCRFEETKNLSKFQAVNPPSQPLSMMTKARREAYFVKISRAVEAALQP